MRQLMDPVRKKEVAAGMVIIVTGLVVLLGSATRAILNREDTFKLHVNFDNPGSLAVGSQVRISGIVGGRVSRVEFLCDENEGRTDDDPCIRVTVEIQARFRLPSLHLHDLNAKSFCLGALVRVHRPDTDLNQTPGQVLFHDSGKGAGMRGAAAFKLVVKIRMGVQLKNVQVIVPFPISSEDGIGHGMVTAQ